MTATILLVRHARHRHVGKILSGRAPGIALSEEGRAEAAELSARLAALPLRELHTSPVQRARETAAAIAAAHSGLAIEIYDALDEIDFGAWTGRSFADLGGEAEWARWNDERSLARPPGGESMAEAQRRVWDHVVAAAARHPGETLAMVSHCDVIRAVVAQVLALPLDAVHRFDIDPASVTRLVVGPWGARVVSLNEGAR